MPSYADEARPLVKLVNHFKWTKVILITSSEEDYKRFFIQFTSLAYDNRITVSYLCLKVAIKVATPRNFLSMFGFHFSLFSFCNLSLALPLSQVSWKSSIDIDVSNRFMCKCVVARFNGQLCPFAINTAICFRSNYR